MLSLYRLSDNGSLEDVSNLVRWVSVEENCSSGDCFKVDYRSRLIGLNEGTFTAEAVFRDEVSSPIQFEVKGKLGVCGRVDNMERSQTRGDKCLHVIEGTTGAAANKWFTEPPRRTALIDLLGYSFSDSYSNEGYKYGAQSGGLSFVYMYMTNNGHPEGQYARYCKDLAQIEFNGRSDWRRATKAELNDLFVNQDISRSYNWPSGGVYYASSNLSDGKVEAVHFNSRTSVVSWSKFETSDKLLASCVSEPQLL